MARFRVMLARFVSDRLEAEVEVEAEDSSAAAARALAIANGEVDDEEGADAGWEPMSADDLTAPPINAGALDWVSQDVEDDGDPEVVQVVALGGDW